ncbi:cytochrome P450 18a1 [Oratosquilla oratoria]|uniref:cytochrome P450 18a1 n=1 Tax=Oratosquilla oratoria TaxID=337810 RepID=UPI003F76B0D3
MTLVRLLSWLCGAGEKVVVDHLCCLLIFITLFLATRYYLLSRNVRLPPGPMGLPFVGYLPFLGPNVHYTLMELADKYGPIYKVDFGNKHVVVLTDPAIIREAFRKDGFTARPSNELYQMFQGYGIINAAGSMWKSQRRFLHDRFKALGVKNFGTGREQMETKIMGEVENIIQLLASEKERPVDIDCLLTNASSNVICSMLMSMRFSHTSPLFLRYMKLQEEGFRLFMASDIACYIPGVKYFPFFKKCFSQLKSNHGESQDILKNIIQVRRETFDPSTVRDILDAYLLEEYKAKCEGQNVYAGKDFERQLVQILNDLFSAGQGTVKTCLMWSMAYLLNYPEVMRKVQEELDSVVGRSRLPTLDDMQYLPYTEATICEVFRRSAAVPLGTAHATTKEMDFAGYTLPKGVTVIPLLYNVHMNSKYWDDPEKFEPERFLDEQGQLYKPDNYMPFGVGRRMCLGDVLARSEMFIFFTSILHVFILENPVGSPPPSMDGILGCTLMPKNFKIRFIPREVSKINIDLHPSEIRSAGH